MMVVVIGAIIPLIFIIVNDVTVIVITMIGAIGRRKAMCVIIRMNGAAIPFVVDFMGGSVGGIALATVAAAATAATATATYTAPNGGGKGRRVVAVALE